MLKIQNVADTLLSSSATLQACGRDGARHLLGGYASIEEFQKQAIEMDSLSNAAFWIHQRQDLIAAVANHRVPKTNYDNTSLDRSFDPADRLTWTKRGTCLHADVIKFCFGSSRTSIEDFKLIMSQLEQWNRCKPDDFTPVFYREHDLLEGRHFPEICFTLDDCGEYTETQHIGACDISNACYASLGRGVLLLFHATHGCSRPSNA